MATPRGGSAFFRAMGQSAASRGEINVSILLWDTPQFAIDAYKRGHADQRGDNRPRSQHVPLPTPRELTKQEQILVAHAGGQSIRACARQFGVAESTIRGWIKKAQ